MKSRILASAALVLAWAQARNLVNGSDPKTQTLKTASEFGEFAEGIATFNSAETIDGAGDTLVTQIIVCAQMGVSFEAALDRALAKDNVAVDGTASQYALRCAGLLGKMADNVIKEQKADFSTNLAEFIHYMSIIAALRGFNLCTALESSYDEIKDRRGVMFHGAFIKSTDPRFASACAELGVAAEA